MRTTFPPIFGLFEIFDRNFAKPVAPPSDKIENYAVPLKELSILKKDWKLRQNWPINGNAMLVRTMHPSNEQSTGLGAWQNYKQKTIQTPCFHTYSRRALYDLSQTLHGDRARRGHQKRWHSFFDPTYSFSYRVHRKIGPNWPTRGFSAITP